MVSKNGEPLNCLARIVREAGKVTLGKVEMAGIANSFMFAPLPGVGPVGTSGLDRCGSHDNGRSEAIAKLEKPEAILRGVGQV
jgi:hypothetical protein